MYYEYPKIFYWFNTIDQRCIVLFGPRFSHIDTNAFDITKVSVRSRNKWPHQRTVQSGVQHDRYEHLPSASYNVSRLTPIMPTFSTTVHRHKPTHWTFSIPTQPSIHHWRSTKLILSTTANIYKYTFILTGPLSANATFSPPLEIFKSLLSPPGVVHCK